MSDNPLGATQGITQRGFVKVEFQDDYDNPCSLQESSSVAPHVWLGLEDADPQIMAIHAAKHGVATEETCGWVPYPVPSDVLMSTRMHLNPPQALQLGRMLQEWAESEMGEWQEFMREDVEE